MNQVLEQIRSAILGRSPLVYLVSAEEGRVLSLLQRLASEQLGAEAAVHTWSCVNGISGLPSGAELTSPLAALRAILGQGGKAFYVMKDLSEFLDQPLIVRALRDAYHALGQEGNRFIFILSPRLVVPELLEKEVAVVHVGPAAEAELHEHVAAMRRDYPHFALPADWEAEVMLALRGLTLNEISHILHRVLGGGIVTRESALEQIFSEKEMIVRKTGYLEFIPPRWDMAAIGGLDVLKDWLMRRKSVFTQAAVSAGIQTPKGLLLMGMSGCGKSLAAKAISSLWNLPLFRLDMNLVFSGLHGSPEAAFYHALQTVEAIAPAVLWIDEIENGLGAQDGSGGANPHIFSAFLTWMQEKPPLVFIAATANRIHDLPAEVIRKGRFDQVFFVDLPTVKERRQIFEIHLRRNRADPVRFDLEYLSVVTEGWNGAEIEQAVVSARTDAYHERRDMEMQDVNRNIASIVPLSKTMEEQMKRIRSWAFGRATPASRFPRERRA